MTIQEEAKSLYEKYAEQEVFIHSKRVKGIICGYNWDYGQIDLIIAITEIVEPTSYFGWNTIIETNEVIVTHRNNLLGYTYLEAEEITEQNIVTLKSLPKEESVDVNPVSFTSKDGQEFLFVNETDSCSCHKCVFNSMGAKGNELCHESPDCYADGDFENHLGYYILKPEENEKANQE